MLQNGLHVGAETQNQRRSFPDVKCLSLLFTPPNRSGKWLCLKGKYYWRETFFTSMIIGGWVNEQQVLGHNRQAFLSLNRVVMTRCMLFFPPSFWSDLGNEWIMVVWASKDCHCPKEVWKFRILRIFRKIRILKIQKNKKIYGLFF